MSDAMRPLDRVGLQNPRFVEPFDHEEGCAYAFGNLTHSCYCLVAGRSVRAMEYAGHRTAEHHDCFLMMCYTLGAEVERLREQLREASIAASESEA